MSGSKIDNPRWKHQETYVELSRTVRGSGAIFDPGCGKTRAVIDSLREYYAGQKGLVNTLIFAPISVCPGWKAQFGLYSRIPQDRILVLTGPGAKRTQALEKEMAMKRPCIVVTNYESAQIKGFYETLLKWSPEAVVADESHRLKDSGGMRAKRIYPLFLGAEKRVIMTGTLTPNSMLDVYGQIKAIAPGELGPSYWQFRSKYFYDKNAGMPAHVHFADWQPRPEAAEMIGRVISKLCVQAKKEDCLDLPPLLEVKIPVEIQGDQKRAYQSMAKDFVAETKGVVSVAEFAMTKTLRLQQILAGFLAKDSESEPAWFEDVARLKALEELLESLNGERCILWTGFRPTYAKLARLCDKLGLKVGFITGEQSAAEKQDAIEGFKSGAIQVVIANPAAAGEGIDGLQCSKYAIYYTRGYNATHFEQSRARNYRGGSEAHESVTHYFLESEGTLDEVIGAALNQKRNLSEAILEWAKNTLAHA